MKNFNEFELIGIGIALLLICIVFSLVGKYIFGLEGDYLSAAATLFAAVVALILFNDWRDPYSAQKVDEERTLLRASVKNFRNNYYAFNSHVLKFPGGVLNTVNPFFAEYMKLEGQLLNSLDDVSESLEFYATYLNEVSTDKNTNTHKDNLIFYSQLLFDFHAEFSKTDPYTSFPETFQNIDKNIRNGFFLKIVEKISKDLPKELATMQKSVLNKSIT